MRIAVVVAALAMGGLGALAAGCGAAGTATQDGPGTTRGVACSFAFSYSSLSQLRRHASAVAVIEPTGAVIKRSIAGTPIDDATVRVVERVSGGRLPATLVVVGVADPKLQGDTECAPDLTPGNAYLVYLARSRRRPGGPAEPGRYVVTGGPAGSFTHRGIPSPTDPFERSFSRSESAAAASLPERVSIADARGR